MSDYIDRRHDTRLDIPDNALLTTIYAHGLTKEQVRALGEYIPRLAYLVDYMKDAPTPQEVSRRTLEL